MNDTWVLLAEAHKPYGALANACNQMYREFHEDADSPRYYRVTVEDITNQPEEPRWWFWEYGIGWRVAEEQGDSPAFVAKHAARVWGTMSDREHKVALWKDAQRQAGKP